MKIKEIGTRRERTSLAPHPSPIGFTFDSTSNNFLYSSVGYIFVHFHIEAGCLLGCMQTCQRVEVFKIFTVFSLIGYYITRLCPSLDSEIFGKYKITTPFYCRSTSVRTQEKSLTKLLKLHTRKNVTHPKKLNKLCAWR